MTYAVCGSIGCAWCSTSVPLANESQFGVYIEWLFHHQKGMTLPAAQQEAERLCGAAQLTKAAATREIDERIARDVELARQFDVETVPRIFIAGGLLTGTLTETWPGGSNRHALS